MENTSYTKLIFNAAELFHISIKTREKICSYGKCEKIEVLRRLGQVINKALTIFDN